MIVNGLGAVMMIAGLVAAFAVGGLVDLIWSKSDAGIAVGGLAFLLGSLCNKFWSGCSPSPTPVMQRSGSS